MHAYSSEQVAIVIVGYAGVDHTDDFDGRNNSIEDDHLHFDHDMAHYDCLDEDGSAKNNWQQQTEREMVRKDARQLTPYHPHYNHRLLFLNLAQDVKVYE